ncbi:MAG: cobalamin-dependent protein, partial [Burkholderiales bacterium]|nr:cobalamin-dependent protein [Burkholderiales bacterium]
MTDLSAQFQALAQYRPAHKLRFVTAASLFDGHDAAINIMRRILMSMGAEVIHLGHNRSVDEIVTAALQEDVHGIAVSSYQGGHIEFFKYMVDLLRQRGGEHIQVFGGGGGVIVADEIRELQTYGVARIYSPEDGQRMGLNGMIGDMLMRCGKDLSDHIPTDLKQIQGHTESAWRALAQLITGLEAHPDQTDLLIALQGLQGARRAPVLGITGTGGAGKSSLTDELIRRIRLDQDDQCRLAVISIDPSRRKSGGALLGDRIRMNAIAPWRQGARVFMRSLATRDTGSEISAALPAVLAATQAAGFDLIIVETSGIGQGDCAVVPHVDIPLYVMTPEFGAASQLEKIDMLDFAEFVAINKFDRKGAMDALRDVAKQVQRNREAFDRMPDAMPVFGTMASRFNDDGVTALYQAIKPRLQELGLPLAGARLPRVDTRHSTHQTPIIPAARSRYLAEISDTVRHYQYRALEQARLAREAQQLRSSANMLRLTGSTSDTPADLERMADERLAKLDSSARHALAQWPQLKQSYSGDELTVTVRDKTLRTVLTSKSLSGTRIPKVALPRYECHGELLKWMLLDNLPGFFPYT